MFFTNPAPIVQTVPHRPNRFLRTVLRIVFALWILGTLIFAGVFALRFAERTQHDNPNRNHRNATHR